MCVCVCVQASYSRGPQSHQAMEIKHFATRGIHGYIGIFFTRPSFDLNKRSSVRWHMHLFLYMSRVEHYIYFIYINHQEKFMTLTPSATNCRRQSGWAAPCFKKLRRMPSFFLRYAALMAGLSRDETPTQNYSGLFEILAGRMKEKGCIPQAFHFWGGFASLFFHS